MPPGRGGSFTRRPGDLHCAASVSPPPCPVSHRILRAPRFQRTRHDRTLHVHARMALRFRLKPSVALDRPFRLQVRCYDVLVEDVVPGSGVRRIRFRNLSRWPIGRVVLLSRQGTWACGRRRSRRSRPNETQYAGGAKCESSRQPSNSPACVSTWRNRRGASPFGFGAASSLVRRLSRHRPRNLSVPGPATEESGDHTEEATPRNCVRAAGSGRGGVMRRRRLRRTVMPGHP